MVRHKVETRLEQKIILTPTLQQAIKLLQFNRIELIDLIKREIEQNPVLEEIYNEETETTENIKKEKEFEPIDFESFFENLYEQVPISKEYLSSEEEPNIENVPCPSMGLQDYLLWQLSLMEFPEDIKDSIEYLINNLNEDGYLSEPIEKLVSEKYNFEMLERAKKILMNFDPLGIGAESVKECLIYQAQPQILKEALEKGWDEILHKDYEGLKRKLNLSNEEILSILNALRYLDPFPGRRYSKSSTIYVEPDVFVIKKGKSFEVSINEDGLPKLRLSKFYLRLLRDPKIKEDQYAKGYIEAKVQSAFWLLKAIEQRKKTLFAVTRGIVKHQEEAIEKGLKFLKPLLLKDIANEVGVHESTVSRIVSNKYMLTPAGISLMRDFFITGIKTVSGELESVEEIKRAILEIVEKENKQKPFNDNQILEILHRNYRIFLARRTVAKYREELNIPCYKERKRSEK